MSHTSEITSIVFTDIPALQATVNDLNKAGIKCSLLRDATPRAYYPDQVGMGLAPYVLRLEKSPYDVGFYDNGKGAYVARTDLFNNKVAAILGATTSATGERPEQAALGKLYQGYAVNAAIRQATKQGYRVTRATKADGTIQLTMSV